MVAERKSTALSWILNYGAVELRKRPAPKREETGKATHVGGQRKHEAGTEAAQATYEKGKKETLWGKH